MSILRVPTASELDRFHGENVGQLIRVLLPILDTFGSTMEVKVDALAHILALWVDQHGVRPDGVQALIMLRIPAAKEFAKRGTSGDKPRIELVSKN